MGILRDFEKRLEGAVEGFFARTFRSGLQPIELAKAVQRYAGNYQQVGVDGVFVPNVYRFELSPEDHERFTGFEESLKGELVGVVKRTAADRGWRLQGPARIELRPSDEITVGTYQLRGKVEAGADAARGPGQRASAPPAAADDGAKTSVLPRPSRSAGAALVVGSDGGRRIQIGESVTLGRLPECDVTLDDPSVSRRHARIQRTEGNWSITDLNSTNGLKVNGTRVGESDLVDGDRLQLGSVQLLFALED
ncbi:MAG: DUF2662 domain-containing protein [Nitriliruptorales bacterium]|nr:DUF2662 domain-containing protein [Nitriliruptorales bacterium]